MVQIYILTYNRPEFVCRAIDSALSQNYDDLQVIVSDNSNNNDTQSLVNQKYNQVNRLTYIKRATSLGAIDHFNCILNEVSSDYFMLFHDDDIMHPNMLSEMMASMLKDESLSAVGANAYEIRKTKRKGLARNHGKLENRVIDRSGLIKTYLTNEGCIPFPSYLYRKSKVAGLQMDYSVGGKYCDVSFLMSVSDRGPILMINEPLMDYYFHAGQDSAGDNFKDRMSLIYHIAKTTIFSMKHPLMKRYRLVNVYGQIKNYLKNKDRSFNLLRYIRLLYIAFRLSPVKTFPRLLFLFINVLKTTHK